MKKIALSVFVVVVTSLCSGQWLERQVAIGDTFGGIDIDPEEGQINVNPVSGSIYVQSDPIQVFTPVTMEKLRGPGASGLIVFCPPSGKGYVLGDSAVVIDAMADTVTGAAALPFAPHACAYSPTSNRLYVGSMDDESLLILSYLA